jgi:putative ABC transport system permease protein
MRWWRELTFILDRLIHRRRAERELDEEISVHRELEIEENIASGMSAEEARYAANRSFGSVALSKELSRNAWGLRWLETLWQDLLYAGRMWSRNPGFTLFAVCGLALAIGANTAVFTIVNAVLFRNMSFPGSDRLAYLFSFDTAHGEAEPLEVFSYREYLDLKERMKSFDELAAFHYGGANLSDDANFPERYFIARITANTLSVLGQKPLLGRDLEPADTQPGAAPVVLLSYRAWESRYSKDESVIGKTVLIDETPVTIIGVTAPGIALPADNKLWLPYITPQGQSPRGERNIFVFGRLANGVSIGQANAEAGAVARQLVIDYPATNKTIGAEVRNISQHMFRLQFRQILQALWGGVAFVLLIACANATNLLLGRGLIRAREMSIRAALGAGRGRIIRQLLTESVLLSVMAGALGALLTYLSVKALVAALRIMGAGRMPSWVVFSMDRKVFIYLAAISIGTGIVFGLAPALRISRIDLSSALKEGGQGAGAGVRRRLLTNILVGAEVALSVVLLMGAVLMIRSTVSAGRVNLGVNTANVLTMQIDLPYPKYEKPQQQITFFQELSARIVALPGVEAATIASGLPGNGSELERMNPFQIEGSPVADESKRPRTTLLTIGPGYFRCLQGRILRGREFTELDGDAGREAVIINQSLADRHWPGENPIGKRIRVDDLENKAWLTIVGVAADVVQTRFSKGLPRVYLPYRQNPRSYMDVVARTSVDPLSLASGFRQSVRDLHASLPVSNLRSLDDHVSSTHTDTRFFSFVFSVLAIIALVLASTGLYAVISQSVNQRTREMAIRATMGASGSRLWRLMFFQGMRQFAIGLVIGLPLSFALGGLLGFLLVGVSPGDPVTYLIVVAVLAIAAALACGFPARRAARTDPAALLRFE